jgi:hypothetical protein
MRKNIENNTNTVLVIFQILFMFLFFSVTMKIFLCLALLCALSGKLISHLQDIRKKKTLFQFVLSDRLFLYFYFLIIMSPVCIRCKVKQVKTRASHLPRFKGLLETSYCDYCIFWSLLITLNAR